MWKNTLGELEGGLPVKMKNHGRQKEQVLHVDEKHTKAKDWERIMRGKP